MQGNLNNDDDDNNNNNNNNFRSREVCGGRGVADRRELVA